MGYRMLSRYRSELMGIAMLWVMCFHSWDLDLGNGTLNLVRSLGFGGVDIFILVSAMGLAYSRCRKRQEYGPYMLRRVSRILPAYYTVVIPYSLFLTFTGQAFRTTVLWNMTGLYYWVRPTGAFNWYIAGILLFYAMLPLCYDLISTRRRPILWTGGVILLLVALCQVLMIDGFWQYTDFFYRLPVFFLGIQMGLFLAEDRPLKGKDVCFWALMLIAGLIYLQLSMRIDGILVRDGKEVGYLPQCHMFLLTTVPMCLILCVLFEKLPLGWLRKVLRLIGENSLEIYLINVSLIVYPGFLQGVIPDGPGCRIRYLILNLLNLVLGFALHWIVESARGRFLAWRKREA